jgi:hypothetical protein
MATRGIEHHRLARRASQGHFYEFGGGVGGLSLGHLLDSVGQGAGLSFTDRCCVQGWAKGSNRQALPVPEV